MDTRTPSSPQSSITCNSDAAHAAFLTGSHPGVYQESPFWYPRQR